MEVLMGKSTISAGCSSKGRLAWAGWGLQPRQRWVSKTSAIGNAQWNWGSGRFHPHICIHMHGGMVSSSMCFHVHSFIHPRITPGCWGKALGRASRRVISKFKGCRIVFWIFYCLRFWIFFWFSFPVPFALYLQQFGTRTCHFVWYFKRSCGSLEGSLRVFI